MEFADTSAGRALRPAPGACLRLPHLDPTPIGIRVRRISVGGRSQGTLLPAEIFPALETAIEARSLIRIDENAIIPIALVTVGRLTWFVRVNSRADKSTVIIASANAYDGALKGLAIIEDMHELATAIERSKHLAAFERGLSTEGQNHE